MDNEITQSIVLKDQVYIVPLSRTRELISFSFNPSVIEDNGNWYVRDTSIEDYIDRDVKWPRQNSIKDDYIVLAVIDKDDPVLLAKAQEAVQKAKDLAEVKRAELVEKQKQELDKEGARLIGPLNPEVKAEVKSDAEVKEIVEDHLEKEASAHEDMAPLVDKTAVVSETKIQDSPEFVTETPSIVKTKKV